MPNTPELDRIAPLIGDRTRARMLAALMDGRARTATELAVVGEVAASTASSHLGRLVAGGLLVLVKQGRHRYYRIADPAVASALEGLMTLAEADVGPQRLGPSDPDLRYARRCYDHLAGEAAVKLLKRLRGDGLIDGDDDAPSLTSQGERWCEDVGIPLARLKAGRRSLCRACLDWSERSLHLAGAVGAALLDRLVERRLVYRSGATRALRVSPAGAAFFEHLRLPR